LLRPRAARAEPAFYKARVEPIFDRHCVVCHGPEKQKAELRLDSFAAALRGSDGGLVIKAGDARGSELLRRIKLPATDEDVMPSDGKPLLSPDEIKIIELWIAGGASAEKTLLEFPGAPVPPPPKPPALPLAPDWRPRAADIAAWERATGVSLTPRSQVPTDGLVLRTASAPRRCDDAAIAKLAPLADLIVEAELARTKISDAALKTIARFSNLRRLDLTLTQVTSGGLAALTPLAKLESLNLTSTAVDERAPEILRGLPDLKHVWLFGTKAEPVATSTEAAPAANEVVAH
jgi:hypothetical protein